MADTFADLLREVGIADDTRSQVMQAAQQRPQRRPMPRQMRQQAPPGPPPRDRQIYGMNPGDVLQRHAIDTEQARYNWTYGDAGERLSAIPQLVGEATGLSSLRYLPHALRAGDTESALVEGGTAAATLLPEVAGARGLFGAGRARAPRVPPRITEPPPAPIRPPPREIGANGLPVRPPEPFRNSMRGGSEDLREAARPRTQQPRPDGGAARGEHDAYLEGLRAEGFDVERPFYHGTDRDFSEFDLSRVGDNFGDRSFGVSLTPDPAEAWRYSGRSGGASNIRPVFARYRNPLVFNAENARVGNESIDAAARRGDLRKLVDEASARGEPYDAIVVMGPNDEIFQVNVLNPENIRPRFGPSSQRPAASSAQHELSLARSPSEPLASSVGGVPVPQVVQRDLRRVGAMVQRRFVDRPPNEGLQRTIIPSAGRNGDEIVIRYGFNGEAPHRGALQNVSDWNGTQTGEITLRKGPFGRLYITGSQIDPLLQEKGLGTQMYADVADWANARGSQLFSDNLMSDGARNVYPALARRGYDIRNVSKDVDAQPRNAPGTPEDERMVFTVASNDQKPIYRIRGRGETPSSTTLYSNMGVPAVIQRDLANVGRLATDGAGAAPRALPRQYEGFGGRAVAMGDAAKLPPEAWATATYAPPRAMRPRTAQDKLAAGLLGIGGAVPAGAGAAYAVQDNIGRGARTQDARLRVQEARQADLHNDVRNMNAGGGSPLMAPKAGFPSLLPPVSPQLHEQARAEIQGLIPEREWGVIDEGLIRRQADVIQRGLRYRGKEPLDAPPPRIFPRDRFAGKRPQQNAPAFRGPGR